MNILKNLHIPQKGEAFTTLLEHKNIKVVRIVSSDQVAQESYNQQENEWVLLLKGKATLIVDQKRIKLKKGDTLFIPAHTPHHIQKIKRGTVWLAVHIW
jgi:cupin 2 domain-containing protein